MTPAEFGAFTASFFANCVQEMARKNKDYSPDDVTLGEVVETACELNITVQQALGVHLRKHWSALTTFLQSERPLASETIDNRLTDAANYLVLIKLWHHKRADILSAMYQVVGRRKCSCHETHTCQRCELMAYIVAEL